MDEQHEISPAVKRTMILFESRLRFKRVQQATQALCDTTLYEDGEKSNGISIAFLMRLTLLRHAAELIPDDDPFYQEAKAYFEK